MNIIEPIDNLGVVSSNNAPSEQLDTWASISHDLLNYIESPVFDIVGNTMITTSSVSASYVYVTNLVTGVVTNTSHYLANGAANISMSPNGLYAYILSKSNDDFILSNDIILISSGAVQYSSGPLTYNALPVTPVINNNVWDANSSNTRFVTQGGFYYVNTSTWLPTFSAVAGAAMVFIERVGANLFMGSSFFLRKTDINGGLLASSVNLTSSLFTLFIYNPTTGDLLIKEIGNGDKFHAVNQSTLALSTAPTGINVPLFSNPKSIKVTATHLIARSLSTSPYWNYYLLSDYSKTNPLPATANPGDGIAEATDYTVIQQDVGIALLDSLNIPIAQQNPNVIAGDSYIYNNRVYEVLIDNDDQPDEGALLPVPTWLDAGLINPLRLFDGKLDSLTTSTTEIVINITPSKIASGIALFNVEAATIQITMTDPMAGLVFDTGIVGMIDSNNLPKSDFVSLELPLYPQAVIQITINGAGFQVAIGEVVLGLTYNLGVAQYSSSVGILDFSEKEQDQFGNFSIVKRKFSKRADYDVKIPTGVVADSQRILSKFRTTPVVWVGDVNREETVIYGYYRSFDIVLSNPALSDAAISVEGL